MARFSDELFGVEGTSGKLGDIAARYNEFVAARKPGEFDVWCHPEGDARIGRGFNAAEPTCYYRWVRHPSIRADSGLVKAATSHVYRCTFTDRAAAFAFWLLHGEFIYTIEGEGL